jgi:hypothetical protein
MYLEQTHGSESFPRALYGPVLLDVMRLHHIVAWLGAMDISLLHGSFLRSVAVFIPERPRL